MGGGEGGKWKGFALGLLLAEPRRGLVRGIPGFNGCGVEGLGLHADVDSEDGREAQEFREIDALKGDLGNFEAFMEALLVLGKEPGLNLSGERIKFCFHWIVSGVIILVNFTPASTYLPSGPRGT